MPGSGEVQAQSLTVYVPSHTAPPETLLSLGDMKFRPRVIEHSITTQENAFMLRFLLGKGICSRDNAILWGGGVNSSVSARILQKFLESLFPSKLLVVGLIAVRLERDTGSVILGHRLDVVRMINKQLEGLSHTSKLMIFAMTLHVMLLAVSASLTSPTQDEPAHLASGLKHWTERDFSWYCVNPPLVRCLASLPALLMRLELPKHDSADMNDYRPEFALGQKFVAQHGSSFQKYLIYGRWICIPFCCLGAIICYLWSSNLYGKSAGLGAALLWMFSPMVLGHASLMTPDAHAASLGLAACYCFWRWLREPTWTTAIVSGLVLGLAEVAKTTLVLLLPLWPVIWIFYRLLQDERPCLRQWLQEFAMQATRIVVALYLINFVYLNHGSFIPLGEYNFRSELLSGKKIDRRAMKYESANRFLETSIANLPLPLPSDYVIGIDLQQYDFETYPSQSYLNGKFADHGWWYYYLLAIAYKAPFGTLGLFLIALVCRISSRDSFRRSVICDELALLLPMLIIFVVVSSKTGFNFHLRYIFPCIPLAFVWVSQVFSYRGRQKNYPLHAWPSRSAAVCGPFPIV